MDDLERVLEEVERLDREATPGPWRGASDHVGGAASGVIEAGAIDVARVPLRANRALIGCYRTTAPLLAAEVRRLRAEVQQRIAHGNALYDAIVRRLAPHFPPDSRDLDWDVLPGTLAAVAQERDRLRAALDHGGAR